MNRAFVALCAAVVGCGDNETCAPTLLARGPLADPYALALPDDCVPGGLTRLPGRWFLVDQKQRFQYSYPRFDGGCGSGFRQLGFTEDDDDSDGYTANIWWDGTRFYTHQYSHFDSPKYEYASTFVACVMPDDTLAAVSATYSTDLGTVMYPMTGERFGLRDAPASGLELVGELGTRADGGAISGFNVEVTDGYAFVVGPTGFDVVDITAPSALQHVAHLDARFGGFNDVKLVQAAGKRIAYAAPTTDRQTYVIDVTDPTAPVAIGSLPYSHSVFTTGSSLYLADYSNAIPEYDVTNPVVPILVGRAPIPAPAAGVHDLFVDGTTIFANNTTAGFVALDATAGVSHAVELARLPTSYSHSSWVGSAGGRKVALHGDEGMTLTTDGAAFVRVLDGDPTSPTFFQELGRYQSRPQVSSHNFVLAGDRAYIAYYEDGVRVLDLTDPTQPVEVAHYNTWDPVTAPGEPFDGALGIRVVDGLIYVADSVRGLLVLREH